MKVDYVKFVKMWQGGASVKRVASSLKIRPTYVYAIRCTLLKNGVKLIDLGKNKPRSVDYKALAKLAASLVKN